MSSLAATTEPRSDQQNYDDVANAPRTVTVSEVRVLDKSEQPVEVHLVEYPGRPYKPSKSMRRILVAAWGDEGSDYVGRQLTLVGDSSIKYGGQTVGGIKIGAMTNLPDGQPLTLNLTITKGKRAPHTVKPLADAPAPKPTSRIPELVAALSTLGITDKAACLAVVSQIADRKLTSANDLTPDELATALDTLAAFNGNGQRARDAFELPAGES